MRGIFLAFVLLGCHAKHEATSGREFFAKFHAAALARDVDTIYKMSTREVRDRFVSAAQFRIHMAEARAMADDPIPLPSTDPEQLARILVTEWLDRHAALIEQMKYVDTTTQAMPMVGEVTTVLVRHELADRDMLMLIEVDGYLKLWQPGQLFATMAFEEAPQQS